MELLKLARATGGLLTIVTLLVMVMGQFLHPELAIRIDTFYIMAALIGALLGVDMVLKRGPVTIEVSSTEEDNDDRNS